MSETLIYIISIFGLVTLIGVFFKMKPGIGIYNLRAIGIILVATLSCLLALNDPKTLGAAMGILGAIAGYLFGAVETKKQDTSSASAINSKFGDNTKIAGRDINETIEKLEGSISNIEQAVIKQGGEKSHTNNDFLIQTIYQRSQDDIKDALDKTLNFRQQDGWEFSHLSSDFQGMDGIYLVFTKPTSSARSEVEFHHGST